MLESLLRSRRCHLENEEYIIVDKQSDHTKNSNAISKSINKQIIQKKIALRYNKRNNKLLILMLTMSTIILIIMTILSIRTSNKFKADTSFSKAVKLMKDVRLYIYLYIYEL